MTLCNGRSRFFGGAFEEIRYKREAVMLRKSTGTMRHSAQWAGFCLAPRLLLPMYVGEFAQQTLRQSWSKGEEAPAGITIAHPKVSSVF